jgi:uncharacterized protein (TIGR03435 family)
MRVIQSVILGISASAILLSQTAAARPEFEVASIKPSEKIDAMSGAQVHVGIQIDGAQVHASSFSVKDYIRIAYKVKDHQVVGPDWIATDRFDIHATLPAGSSRDQVPEMLQALLEQRFQLKMHRGSREFPVYAIVVAKDGASKLKQSPLDPEVVDASGRKAPLDVQGSGGRGGTTVKFGRGAYYTFGDNKFEAHKLTMQILADTLSRYVERPVIDMTGLDGTYDVALEFTPEDYRVLLIRSAISAGITLPPEALMFLQGASDESIFKGLQTVGLKLEQRKAPLEVLIVDSASKTPTDN